MGKWRIKKEHINEEGCFAYGGGVADVQDPSLAVQNADLIQIDPVLAPSAKQATPMPTANSVNPFASLFGATPVAAPVAQAAPQAPAMPKTETSAPQQPNMPATVGGQSAAPYMAEAAAQGKIAREQTALYDKAAQSAAALESDYQTKANEFTQKRDTIAKYLDENPVDADRYFKSKTPVGKVSTAIGLILGGIGGGLNKTGQNVALDFLNKQIDNDVKAQVENRRGQENLLSQLEKQFGNEATAKQMLQSTLQTRLANQINAAALRSGDQLAIARAQQVTQQLQAQAQGPIQAAAREQSINSALAGGQDMAALSPYMDEKQRGRAIPGMGLASTEQIAKKMNEEVIPAYQGAKQGINELKQFGTLDRVNPVARSKAEAIQTRVIGQLRMVLLGPGTISDAERALIKNVVANPTDLFSIANKEKLETLNQALDKDFAARAKQAGVKVPSQQQAPAASSSIKSFRPSR